VQFAQDLLISAGTSASDIKAGKEQSDRAFKTTQRITSQTVVAKEIARRLNSLSLEPSASLNPGNARHERGESDQHNERLIPRREGFIRGQSEPPPSNAPPAVPSLSRIESPPPYSEQGPADYTWEWGGFPTKTPGVNDQTFDFSQGEPSKQQKSKAQEPVPPSVQKVRKDDLNRSNSTPIVTKGTDDKVNAGRPKLDNGHAHTEPVLPDEAHSKHVEGQHGHLGKLKNDEEDPYKFMLDTPSVCHTFELSMSAPDDDTDVEVRTFCSSLPCCGSHLN
jgi:hypothetical protein